jgi:septal ring factor EnvC (AmiA/AmiB activator)
MSKYSSEQRREILRKARATLARSSPARRATFTSRAATGGLVFKTTVTERTQREVPQETSTTDGEYSGEWWQWVDARIEDRVATLRDATGKVLGQMFEQERRELDLLRREFTQLRGQIGLERELKKLRREVEAARAQVPDFDAERQRLQDELADVRRELEATKKKLGKLRVDQSVQDYKLSQMQKQAAAAASKPSVEMELQTSSSRLVMRDLHPDAARALREFAAEVIDARSGGAILFSGPAGTA